MPAGASRFHLPDRNGRRRPEANREEPNDVSDHEKTRPNLKSAGHQRADSRLERQARALRENLRKRKAQQRHRAEDETDAAPTPAPDGGLPGLS